MTPKQERFCVEYVVDSDAAKAAIRAGYSPKTAAQMGYKLVHNSLLQERIATLRKEQEGRTLVDADYVITSIHEVAERCLQREPVMVGRGKDRTQLVDGDGNDVWQFDAAGANRSLELLGKHFSLFVDRVEHSGTMDIRAVNKAIPDADS